ncbi:MAG: hypothetical protein HQ557_15105 [Bacteroidetes bacterium]|nr:hypothetical protein [Bacteroidota bacterium]
MIWASWYPIVFLVIDFFIRAVLKPKFSLTALISRTFLAKLVRFKKRLILEVLSKLLILKERPIVRSF